jgi:hypothetical protein
VTGDRIDEEKLLLDADRERRFRAKGIPDLVVRAQAFPSSLP